MATDDVIELVSSDEETEPVPKKKKPPNTMVYIPHKLPGVSIQPSKSASKFNPAILLKGAIGKSVTVTKVSKGNVNPFATQKKLNGKPNKSQPAVRNVHIPIAENVSTVLPKTVINNTPVNNKTALNKLNKTGVIVTNKVKGNIKNKTAVNPLNVAKTLERNVIPIKFANTVTKTPTVKNISALPQGITVKRTTPPNSKPDAKRMKLSPRVVQMSKVNAISTNEVVDLDDDEPASSSASPQWYVRPEDQLKTKKTPEKVMVSIVKTTTKEKSNKGTLKQLNTAKGKSPQVSEIEQQNNKEPEKTIFFEVPIDDSPVKPILQKKGFIVGTELPITIEDSPAKSLADKPDPNHSSDEECAVPSKTPNSKKKLEYPKPANTIQMVESIEIEFEPLSDDTDIQDKTEPKNKERNMSEDQKPGDTPKETDEIIEQKETSQTDVEPLDRTSEVVQNNIHRHEKHKTEGKAEKTDEKKEKHPRVAEIVEIVEIEESPVKSPEEETHATPKKNKEAVKPVSKPEYKLAPTETMIIDDKEKEFHPIYQSFINLCFELENSDDMKKIVEKKIKSYYRQVPKEYTESEAFTDMILSKVMAMKAGPEKMYLYIKDVVDELNLQRKLAKALPAKKPAKNEEQEKFLYGEESEFDSKRQRQIYKLEKTMKKLHRAIQKLEEQEVDFDDEDDSVYILTESEDNTSTKDDRPPDKEVLLKRYKERMVRVHAKLCQLTNTKMPSEARVQIDARPGQPKGPAKRLEKWINKKVPIGTPLPFPDFHDVLRCVKEANQEDNLGWNEVDVMEEARDLFTRCGKKLQRRRQENEWRLAASRIPTDVADPAENDTDLKKKLEENRRVAAKKETEVIKKYADRQNQLNLEAVEISDKEAEESPDESDDEETGDDSALTSKEKRKERLRRLLQEKSKNKENRSKDDQTVDGDNSLCKEVDPKEANSTIDDQNKDIANDKSSQNEDTVEGKSSPSMDRIENVEEVHTKDTEEKRESEDKDKGSNEGDVTHKMPSKVVDKGKATELGSCSTNKDDNKLHDKVHSVSDDSNKVESDIDELHLLQKLYSENELNTSVMDSTDSGTPIAISDTSANNSSDDNANKKTSDVISIENSSYSESEEKKGEFSKDSTTDNDSHKETTQGNVNIRIEKECSNDVVQKKTIKTNNEEYSLAMEDILLASSDEADDAEAPVTPPSETYINLRDDNISIGETVIESGKMDNDSCKSHKNANTDASSVEGMEFGPTESCEKHNCIDENIAETTSVNSTDDGIITEITCLKSAEPNKKGNAAETTSIKSVETIEDVSDTGVKSHESVMEVCEKPDENEEDRNISETGGVRSVETLDDESNSDIQAVKSVETLEDESNSDSQTVKFVETVENDSKSDTQAVNSVEILEDECNNDIQVVKSVETLEDECNSDSQAIKSVESLEDECNNDIQAVKSVETLEDDSSNDAQAVKSVKALEDESNDDTQAVTSVEFHDEVNANETASVKSDETNNAVTAMKFVESVGDKTLTENSESSIQNAVAAMDTADTIVSNDPPSVKAKEDSVQDMDVDIIKT